jgi:hypothetical protein
MDQTNDISSDTIVENVPVGDKRDAAYDRAAIAAYFHLAVRGIPRRKRPSPLARSGAEIIGAAGAVSKLNEERTYLHL